MPTQKIFKQRVRARMTKTGESYTAARRQLLRKAPSRARGSTATGSRRSPASEPAVDADALPDASLVVADARWSARPASATPSGSPSSMPGARPTHTHTEIARWLSETHGAPGWWTQNITVAYERARGMRARHQMRDGFSISVTRTVGRGRRAGARGVHRRAPSRALAPRRSRCASGPTRAALSARFDWADPPSRVVVGVVPKGADKTVVAVDARAAARRRVRRAAQGAPGASGSATLKTHLERRCVTPTLADTIAQEDTDMSASRDDDADHAGLDRRDPRRPTRTGRSSSTRQARVRDPHGRRPTGRASAGSRSRHRVPRPSIALVRARSDDPAGIDTGIRFATEDAAADHAALKARGVDADAEVIPYPVPMFILRDPDGNRLIMVERRLRADHGVAFDTWL